MRCRGKNHWCSRYGQRMLHRFIVFYFISFRLFRCRRPAENNWSFYSLWNKFFSLSSLHGKCERIVICRSSNWDLCKYKWRRYWLTYNGQWLLLPLLWGLIVRWERGGISWLEGWGIVVLLLNILLLRLLVIVVWSLRHLLLMLIAILTTLEVIGRVGAVRRVHFRVVLVRILLGCGVSSLVVFLVVGLFRRSKLLRCRVVAITVLSIAVWGLEWSRLWWKDKIRRGAEGASISLRNELADVRVQFRCEGVGTCAHVATVVLLILAGRMLFTKNVS